MDTRGDVASELKRPEAYPFQVGEVGFLQTHISLLFFAGERVYKIKKPVDLGFLDFTTLERRRHFCEEEVRLNRRLAADTYLGVVPVVRDLEGRLKVRAEGEVVDWAVEMVQLPAERMLDRLLERGEIDNSMLNDVAELLAAFHREAPTGDGVDEHGAPAAVARNALENFEQVRAFARDEAPATGPGPRVLSLAQLEFLERRTQRTLETLGGLLERRVQEGRIREGHGDLHAGNICFTERGVVAYDCIEFNRRFRCGDVASELAFLAMDLDRRGFPGFSAYLVRRYADLTDDPELRTLMPFYKGYRAVVRGKVSAMTAADPARDEGERRALVLRAMRSFQLAATYELPPVMVLTCGLPGSGKSWLAKRLTHTLRAGVLHSDVRRKLMAGKAPTERVRGGYGAGLYSPNAKQATYNSLLQDALDHLESGRSVIVDATFSRRRFRAPFVQAAARLGLPYVVLHVSAPDEVIRDRIARRENETRVVSDADIGVYEKECANFEAPDEVPCGNVVAVSSHRGAPEEASSSLIDSLISLYGGVP